MRSISLLLISILFCLHCEGTKTNEPLAAEPFKLKPNPKIYITNIYGSSNLEGRKGFVQNEGGGIAYEVQLRVNRVSLGNTIHLSPSILRKHERANFDTGLGSKIVSLEVIWNEK